MQPEQKTPLSGTSSVEVPLSVGAAPPSEPVRGVSAKWYVAGALSFFILAGAGIGLFYHFDGKLQLADWQRLATEQRIDSLQEDGRIDTLNTDNITSRELTVLGSATINRLHTEIITASGDVGIEGTATTGALVVRGATVLAGDTNIAQGLSVDGDSTIAKAFNVDGTTTLKSLAAAGKVSFTGSQDDLVAIYPTGEKNQTVFVVRTLTGQDIASLDASGNFILAGGMTVGGELIVPKATVGDAVVGTLRATNQAVFTAIPSGSGINQGAVYINPATANASDTLLGAAVGGVEKFRVDASGNVYGSNIVVTGSVTSGDTTVNNLSVLDNTVLGTDATDVVTVNGTSLFNAGVTVSGVSTLQGNVSAQGSLSVSGASTFAGVSAGSLTVSGATSLSSTLAVTGTTTLADLIASGQIRLTGNAADRLVIQPTTDPGSTTKVFTIKNAAGAEQASLTNDGTLNLVGAANIGGTLGVTGATTLGVLSAGTSSLGALTVVATSDLQGNTTVGGTFGVTGATTLASLSAAATSLSSLSVSGTSTLSGNATMGAALNVTGNTTLSANLTVAGTTTMSGGMNITGPTTMLAGTSTTVPLVIRGAPSQTADLLQLQNDLGTVLAKIDATGNVHARTLQFVNSSGSNIGQASYDASSNVRFGVLNGGGAANVAIGQSALQSNYVGSDNIAIGRWTMDGATTGSQNIAIGGGAANNSGGNSNISIGYQAGRGVTTGSDNSFLGAQAGSREGATSWNTFAGISRSTAIGASAQVQASDAIVLGSVDNTTKVGIGITIPQNLLSVSPVSINSSLLNGISASQSGNTVTATTGAPFTAANVGDTLIWANDGTTAIVTGFTDSTTITISTTATRATGFFRTHKAGLQVTTSGLVGINTTSPGAQLQLNASSATTIGQIVRGASLQSADLWQAQDSNGTVLSRVDAGGMWYLGPNAHDLHSYKSGTNSGLEFGNGTGFNFVLRAGGNDILSVADTSNAGFIFNRAAVINGSNSGLQVSTGTTANGPVIVARNGVAATGDLQQWQNSSSTVLGKVTAGGGLSFQAQDDTTNAGYFATRNVAGSSAAALVLQATHSGNSAFILEAKNYLGAVVASIDRNGDVRGARGSFPEISGGVSGLTLTTNGTNASVGIGVAGSGNGSALHVQAKQFNFVGQILQGLSGQTADLLQARDSTGAVMASIGATGDLSVKNTTVTGTLTVTGNATFSGNVISWSNNVRGINQTVAASATSTAVVFGTAYPDATYAVNCTPNYNTTCWITGKTTAGFTVNYGTAAPVDGSGRVDWFVAH